LPKKSKNYTEKRGRGGAVVLKGREREAVCARREKMERGRYSGLKRKNTLPLKRGRESLSIKKNSGRELKVTRYKTHRETGRTRKKKRSVRDRKRKNPGETKGA